MLTEFILMSVVPAVGAFIAIKQGDGGVGILMVIVAIGNLIWMAVDPKGFSKGSDAPGGCEIAWDARANPVVCY